MCQTYGVPCAGTELDCLSKDLVLVGQAIDRTGSLHTEHGQIGRSIRKHREAAMLRTNVPYVRSFKPCFAQTWFIPWSGRVSKMENYNHSIQPRSRTPSRTTNLYLIRRDDTPSQLCADLIHSDGIKVAQSDGGDGPFNPKII